jgi:carbamoyltransferase
MLFTAQVESALATPQETLKLKLELLNRKSSDIPAVTHVDHSARIQTVTHDNELYHQVLFDFYKITGCPVLINTSFNVRGEPIVCSPNATFHCFMGTDIDYLVIGRYVLSKKKQSDHIKFSYGDWRGFD